MASRLLWLPASIAFVLAGLGALLSSDRPELAAATLGAAGVVGLGTAGLAIARRERRASLTLALSAVPAHWVQALMHVGLFAGWAPYFPEVVRHLPHFAAQILFYYAIDLLLAWWRHGHARLGFGPIPIVGSVNLFLWFRDEWFFLQFALLALGALAKEFVTWERGGARTHVFNPSSFPLFVFCLVLWFTDADALTWSAEIAVSQGQVPYAWLGIFVLGLVVQSLFAVTLVTLAALAAIFAASLGYTEFFGTFLWVDVGVPAGVFLGCHFLITDPATSPQTTRGRVAFGALYGALVFALYVLLRETGGPSHYDKLLCVPLLNLLVRRFDALGSRPPTFRQNGFHVGLAILLFGFFRSADFVGLDHPGDSLAFWDEACVEERWWACRTHAGLVDQRCHEGEWGHCGDYAKLLESGRGPERDLAAAGYHYTLACQNEIPSACAEIPRFRANGGDDALRDACDAADGLSCLVLGSVLTGHLGGPADPAASDAALRRACELELAEACDFIEGASR